MTGKSEELLVAISEVLKPHTRRRLDALSVTGGTSVSGVDVYGLGSSAQCPGPPRWRIQRSERAAA